MSLSTHITDGKGSKSQAEVTERGQLVTAPLDFSTPVFKSLTIINTAYNFFKPRSGYQLVITDIILEADKNVSATTGALVEIFTASSATGVTATDDVITLQPLKNTSRTMTGLNFIIDAGTWLNATTDDATCYLTIAGYYVKEVS